MRAPVSGQKGNREGIPQINTTLLHIHCMVFTTSISGHSYIAKKRRSQLHVHAYIVKANVHSIPDDDGHE